MAFRQQRAGLWRGADGRIGLVAERPQHRSQWPAVLEMLGRFTEDLTALQRAIRRGDGAKLEDWFTRTRAIRRSIIEQGQDDAKPDFGRSH